MVRQAANFYRSVQSLHVEVVTSQLGSSDQKILPSTYELWMERPANLATRDSRGELPELVLNSQDYYVIERSKKRYSIGPPLGTFEELALNPSPLADGGWGVMFAPVLLCDDPYTAIMAGVDAIELVGSESVEGVTANHISFRQSELNWNMWIAVTGDPLVLRLEFDRGPRDDTANRKTRIDYRAWQLNPTLPPERFLFDPPASFERVGRPEKPDLE
jgi:hypothetical protein